MITLTDRWGVPPSQTALTPSTRPRPCANRTSPTPTPGPKTNAFNHGKGLKRGFKTSYISHLEASASRRDPTQAFPPAVAA